MGFKTSQAVAVCVETQGRNAKAAGGRILTHLRPLHKELKLPERYAALFFTARFNNRITTHCSQWLRDGG